MDLLANYGSDSDTEQEDDYFSTDNVKNKEESETKEIETLPETKTQPSTSFFFSGNVERSDDSEDDDNCTSEEKRAARKRKPGESITELDGTFESKIFDNEYAKNERINANMLSKHVDLSEKPTINKKKSKFTCKAYLKGKCRYGDNCRFAHPVHNRSDDIDTEGATISSEAKFYTEAAPQAQVFHSKKFKSSAGQ